MLYLKCPTCKQILADRQVTYDTIHDSICADEDSCKITEQRANELKRELINSLNFERYCCKQRMMTYTKLIEIIK